MGDFNGRVGVRRTPWTKHHGPHSDHRTPCNCNGNHVLELCAEHDLIITNTFFQHRETQIYTWYKWNNIDVSSQIDFTLARSRMRCNIRDSRAIPNAGLDTDHRPVITTLVTEKKRKINKKKKQLERLNMHKLQDEEVQTKIKCTVSEKFGPHWPYNTKCRWSLGQLQDSPPGHYKRSLWHQEDRRKKQKGNSLVE